MKNRLARESMERRRAPQEHQARKGEVLREFRDDDSENELDDEANFQPIEVRMVPEDQIKGLTDEQKHEVFTKALTATDPHAPKAVVTFNVKDGVFKTDLSADHTAVHFSMDSELLHKESDEAQEHAMFSPHLLEKKSSAIAHARASSMEETDDADTFASAVAAAGRPLRNQFNLSERATQTFNNPMRDRKVVTEPPPTQSFSANVTKWDMFDTYLDDVERSLASKNFSKPRGGRFMDSDDKDAEFDTDLAAAASTIHSIVDAPAQTAEDLLRNPRLLRALQLSERIVNQNAEADVFHDYKYFEDRNEVNRPDGRGSFVPLWRLTYDKAKKKTVTALAWNPRFTDLLAAGYGSYDFLKQSDGLICVYTLKNTAHPEYVFQTESGVLCLDWHPQHPALLCAGFYDGSVAVFDVRRATMGAGATRAAVTSSKAQLHQAAPLYQSTDPKVKHTDPVWQVHWQPDEPGSNLGFYSISSDGRVTNWVISKNELTNEEIVELKLTNRRVEDQDVDTSLVGLAGGSCFDFNPHSQDLFIVGTEEGNVHLYSKGYNSPLLFSYEGHHMPVYSVRCNPWHARVFMSCSADWTLKIWEQSTAQPIMSYDLNTAVGDVAWAPYSSTVFAAVTADGVLRLFDLAINKHEPIGELQVHKKAKLTHVAFNPRDPVIAVGDSRGMVSVFKLSNNLHRMSSPRLDELDSHEEQLRLDKLLLLQELASENQGASGELGRPARFGGTLPMLSNVPLLPLPAPSKVEHKESSKPTSRAGARTPVPSVRSPSRAALAGV